MSSPVSLLVDDRGRSKDVQGEVEAGKDWTRKKEIKPWRCAKVYFRVIPPEKRHKKRRENLERLKTVASEGICNTPYVEARWSDGKSSVALLAPVHNGHYLPKRSYQRLSKQSFQRQQGWKEEEYQGKIYPFSEKSGEMFELEELCFQSRDLLW